MLDYLNIKEYPKDKGILLDSCNSEDRLYYNGCYYDLCGMSVQDYINSTLLNCSGVSNNNGSIGGGGTIIPPVNDPGGNGGNLTPDTNLKISNKLIFSYNDSNMLTIALTYEPQDDITVSFDFNNTNHTFTLLKGGKSITTGIKIETSIAKSLNNVSVSPSSDETYSYGFYVINDVPVEGEYLIYYGMINTQIYNSVDSNYVMTNFENEILNKNEKNISYIVPAASVDTNNMDDEEYENWEKNNMFFKALVIPSELYNNDGTLNFNFLTNGVNGFIGFNNIKTMNINNIVYILLVDNDESDAFINSDNTPLTIGSYKIML